MLPGIPRDKDYKIPSKKNYISDKKNRCQECISSVEKIGGSFLKMINNNFISEMPFSDRVNNILLHCSRCGLKNKTVALKIQKTEDIRTLRKRGGGGIIDQLWCPDCKH